MSSYSSGLIMHRDFNASIKQNISCFAKIKRRVQKIRFYWTRFSTTPLQYDQIVSKLSTMTAFKQSCIQWKWYSIREPQVNAKSKYMLIFTSRHDKPRFMSMKASTKQDGQNRGSRRWDASSMLLSIQSLYLYLVYIIINITEMDNLLREKITQLTSKCDILQKNGKYLQCIDIMEEIVSIKKSVYGIDHPEFDKASEKLCEYLNLAAMVELQKQQFDLTIDHLRKAQLVARNSLALKSTTFNNMACYYRRTGKVRTALSYLIQALELQLKIDEPKTLADTHLNLCAVLSQLDRHEDALQHSMLSIILLQDEFLKTLLAKYRQGQEGTGDQQINDERLAVLAIAYHNLGVEFEHLKRFEEALKIYKKALKFSKDNLSNNEQLVKNLTRVVNSATEQIQQQRSSMALIEQKSSKLERGVSETKKDIYKELSKTVERYRHLPKLKFNSREHSSLISSYEPSVTIQPVVNKNRETINFNAGKTSRSNQKQKFGQKFGNQTKYKLGAMAMDTPESRGQMDSQLKVRQGMGTRTNRDTGRDE